jgi:hypothetical protein
MRFTMEIRKYTINKMDGLDTLLLHKECVRMVSRQSRRNVISYVSDYVEHDKLQVLPQPPPKNFFEKVLYCFCIPVNYS